MAKRAPKPPPLHDAAPEAPPVVVHAPPPPRIDLAHALQAAEAAIIAERQEGHRILATLAKCVRALNFPVWRHDESHTLIIVTPKGEVSWSIGAIDWPMFAFIEDRAKAVEPVTDEQKRARLDGWVPALRRT